MNKNWYVQSYKDGSYAALCNACDRILNNYRRPAIDTSLRQPWDKVKGVVDCTCGTYE